MDHRPWRFSIARAPCSLIAVKDRVNAIALAPVDDFRRDSDLFGAGARDPVADCKPR